jgi:hypothetical protein
VKDHHQFARRINVKIKFGLSLLVLLLVLSACQPSAPAQPIPTLTPVPGVNATQALPPATVAPVVPTVAPSATPAVAAPTEPAVATPTPTVAAPTNTSVPSDTPSPVPTASPTKALASRPTATATSSGPLSAQVYVANCRSAPTSDKPGNVIIQISVEAKGGNGVYLYAYEGTASKTKFIDIAWEKGTRLIGEATVKSGDGQSIKVVVDINTGDLTCP